MSNAESDRKPGGSAENDDEPDEWYAGARFRFANAMLTSIRDTRIFSTGCAGKSTSPISILAHSN
jgi:hypothetical protein